jgi:hypothetical protein
MLRGPRACLVQARQTSEVGSFAVGPSMSWSRLSASYSLNAERIRKAKWDRLKVARGNGFKRRTDELDSATRVRADCERQRLPDRRPWIRYTARNPKQRGGFTVDHLRTLGNSYMARYCMVAAVLFSTLPLIAAHAQGSAGTGKTSTGVGPQVGPRGPGIESGGWTQQPATPTNTTTGSGNLSPAQKNAIPPSKTLRDGRASQK